MDGVGRERGVSPVIGVILMVAIVVVLAAVVGVFALDFRKEPADRPQIAGVADYDERSSGNGEYLNVTFQSGDVVDTGTVTLRLTDAAAVGPSGRTPVEVDGDQLDAQLGTRIHAGETLSVDAEAVEKTSGGSLSSGEHLDLSEATVRIVWNPADPDTQGSAVIWQWSKP